MPVWTRQQHLHEEGGVGMFELIIVWDTGEQNIYSYETEEEAIKGAGRIRMAFGEQIRWTGVRRKNIL